MIESHFTINPEEAGLRIDVLAAQKCPEISRSRWQKHGEFKCDSVAKNPKTKVKTGENWIAKCEPETNSDHLEPWDHRLKILQESDSWVVVEKPYGIAVHPSISDNSHKTLVNALVHLFGENLSENFDEIEGRSIPRPGLVHRLDKTTSGVILIAKTNEAHRYFQTRWSDFSKTYHAIVRGQTPQGGKIESGIDRDLKNRQKMTAANNDRAKWAITEFERLEANYNGKNQTLLQVDIHTGRTHQIRVHLSSIGFPIVGDVLYEGPKAERVMLHASRLKFTDPDNQDAPVVIDSEVPF